MREDIAFLSVFLSFSVSVYIDHVALRTFRINNKFHLVLDAKTLRVLIMANDHAKPKVDSRRDACHWMEKK